MNVATVMRADLVAMQKPAEIRRHIRTGDYADQTGGMAFGYVQANLAIVTADYADDFLRYCQRNAQPCPLLAASEPGDPRLPALGEDLDIRTDLPRYRVWRDGELAEEVTDLSELWRDDFVTFALGCSYSFEEALLADGLRIHHVDRGYGPPRYYTTIETVPAGPFRGGMVVSMRSFRSADAIRAIQITSRFPWVHGAPVHIGDPKPIGIDDMDAQCDSLFFGIPEDEIPLFWACGVTPQSAVQHARPPVFITHKPAHMLITDVPNSKLSVI